MKVIALTIAMLIASGAAADTNMTSSVLDATGGHASGGTLALAYAAGQPGGVRVSSSGNKALYAGFLGTFSLRPGLDTDADGLADEVDQDNDNDTLSDLAELDGSAFGGWAVTDPNKPDSDGDGMADDAEAAGMYDPNDPNHRLAIVDLQAAGGNVTLTWVGKGGGTVNTILGCDDLVPERPTNLVHSAAYAGGDSPWYKATNTHTWAESESPRFYSVQTAP